MDTKTPPIPLKYQEKKPQHKKQEKSAAEVSLPPLTPVPNGTRQKLKNSGTQWSRGTPYVSKDSDQKSKRPYRILHLGATPLMHACQQGDRSRVLRLLHDQEETIGYRDRTLRNALHYCMDAGTAGAVASAAPELINASDAEGHTPLHLAVIAGDTQLVAVLLANGADVNAKDLEGHSVLHWATVCGEAESVRLVLAAGARPSTPDLRGGSPLHYAAQCCGAAATAELSVPKKIGLKVLQTLLEFNADVNAKDEDGRQPILWAASAGSVEAVLALARAGGLAAAGATDKDGLTALHCAASRGHARCVEALVNLCGSQPDHVDDNGCSALHYAATLGHADATALLLKLSADPNRQDRKGRTPALCAAAKGQLETLKILAQHGGSLHARTIRGTGVAHEAVLSGRIELIEWLARKKPSTLDVATHDGRTPLHVAALHGYLDVCKVLLDHGAKINSIFRTTKSGPMTPLDAALYRGHRDCAKLIQMHGGATSQHLRTHRTAPNRVFAAKLKVKKNGGSSSASDSECNHRSHRKTDLYFEEHWIERRTRKRANKKRIDNRRGSRSYSEEEVRLSKASRRDRERRAKSESSRYKRSYSPEEKNHSKHEYSESSSELDDESSEDDDIIEGRNGSQGKKIQADADDDRSLSDDSLEVVVVKRSLEKKSEKVQYSGKKLKTPREISRETKVTETERRSKKKLKSAKSRSKSEKESNKIDGNLHTEESPPKEDENSEDKGKKITRFQEDMTDSTSQENVEQVTVTALVHKDQTSDNSITNQSLKKKEEEKSPSSPNQISKSKMDHILEKADEMQNALVTKAADLKKDVEEIRRQMSEEVHLNDETEKQMCDNTDEKKMSKSEESDETESESNSEDSQMEFSRLQSQQEVSSPKKQGEDSSPEVGKKSLISEIGNQDKIMEPSEEQIKIEEEKTSPSPKTSPSSKEKSSSRSKKSNSSTTEVTCSEKESRQTSPSVDPTKNESTEPKIEKKISDDSEDLIKINEQKKGSEITEEIKVEKKHTQLREELEQINEEKYENQDSPNLHHIDSSSGSGKSSKRSHHTSRPSTGKTGKRDGAQSKSPSKASLFESSGENSPDRSAIVAVIESPEWDEEDEEVAKEIRDVVGDDAEPDTDPEDNDSLGVLRVLPSTSENSTPRSLTKVLKASKNDILPPVERRIIGSPKNLRNRLKQRRDSGGRDSGIEPSPRVSKIPKRTVKCCPITEKQRTLNMDTITRDVQISLRRYHLERKIFFQLMELKRLQIRHGRANEQVLVKRQVEAFHKAGMSGPALGVAKYDQPLTFRHFETFLYEQLRHLQRRPATPDWCTGAKQCTQKTHRCHHATSAYTSVPIYTYLGGGSQEREEGNLLPKIESRGRGQMTVEVTRGEEKQIIALPAEKLDRTKRYYVTFTVRGESQDSDIPKTPRNAQRNTKSV